MPFSIIAIMLQGICLSMALFLCSLAHGRAGDLPLQGSAHRRLPGSFLPRTEPGRRLGGTFLPGTGADTSLTQGIPSPRVAELGEELPSGQSSPTSRGRVSRRSYPGSEADFSLAEDEGLPSPRAIGEGDGLPEGHSLPQPQAHTSLTEGHGSEVRGESLRVMGLRERLPEGASFPEAESDDSLVEGQQTVGSLGGLPESLGGLPGALSPFRRLAERLASDAEAAVTITYASSLPGMPPADFAGLSMEKAMILSSAYGTNFFSPNNSALVSLFARAKVASLRVGGHTGDWPNCTDPQQPPFVDNPCVANYTPTADDIARLASFAEAAGVQTLAYMLSIEGPDPEVAAEEATELYSALGNSSIRVFFELGNEEDLVWDVNKYISVSRTYIERVRARVPGALFWGPNAAWNPAWPGPTTAALPLNASTLHNYAGNGAGSWTCSVDYLLHLSESQYSPWVQSWRNAAGVPRRITEANTCWGGGTRGVSDTFATTLFLLDYMHFMASRGIAGVNVHWGASRTYALYNPILPTAEAAEYTAAPVLYSVTAFSLLNPGGGGQYINLTITGFGCNARAYAFTLQSEAESGPSASKSKSQLGFVLINRNWTAACMATIHMETFPGKVSTAAQALWLVADSVHANDSSSFGFCQPDAETGQPVLSARVNLDQDTSPTFAAYPKVSPSSFSVSLPPVSILLMKFPWSGSLTNGTGSFTNGTASSTNGTGSSTNGTGSSTNGTGSSGKGPDSRTDNSSHHNSGSPTGSPTYDPTSGKSSRRSRRATALLLEGGIVPLIVALELHVCLFTAVFLL